MRAPQLFSAPPPPTGINIVGPVAGDIWVGKSSGVFRIYVAIETGTFDSDGNPYVKLVDGMSLPPLKGDTGPAGPGQTVLLFTIDGQGQVPTAGATSWGNIVVPYNCTVTGWVLMSDKSGDAVIDVQKTSYQNFPSGFASICGGDKPTLASNQKQENLSVSAWSTALATGDVLSFLLNSVDTITRLNLAIVVSIP